jgi:SAM-dependent methyltransferase
LASQEVHFTGERVIPGEVNQDLWNEHYSRYRFAACFAQGKRVLDVGCGAGYGTALLAETAAKAIGFDVSIEAVEYAKAHYGQKATFLAGDAIHFPAEGHAFELVTAFEVIEHVAEYERLIAEAARVLADDGIFIVSTPNKVYYSETRREVGPNPYHVHEFELEEFGAVLRRSFPHVQVVAQNQQEAVVFGGPAGGGASYLTSEPPLETAQFFIALCGSRPLTTAPFTYVAEAGNLLREREHYIRLLQDELARAQADHLHLLEEHNRSGRELEKSNAWALSLDHELTETRQMLSAEQEKYQAVQRDAEEKAKWALDLDRQLQDKSTELAKVVAQQDKADLELVKRTEWAREQEALCAERTRWAQDQEKIINSQATAVRELQDLVEERTRWAQDLDHELATTRSLVEERTAWALRLDAELTDHSSVGHMLRSELRALAERAADLAGSEANLERLSNQLKEENRQLKEQLRRNTRVVEASQGQLAAIGVIADRLSHERELVRTSKWLRLGKLLHLGPRLAEDNPPV